MKPRLIVVMAMAIAWGGAEAFEMYSCELPDGRITRSTVPCECILENTVDPRCAPATVPGWVKEQERARIREKKEADEAQRLMRRAEETLRTIEEEATAIRKGVEDSLKEEESKDCQIIWWKRDLSPEGFRAAYTGLIEPDSASIIHVEIWDRNSLRATGWGVPNPRGYFEFNVYSNIRIDENDVPVFSCD
ncbi:MAG: hypothetical protein U5S82_14080 [Gammaproteobacteria bacterium]|nr:hypothetical protein [Gammaproteobacteria bacterium]